MLAIVAAHNEAERIAGTLAAFARAFPGAALWVADDCSSDGTSTIAERAGARVVRSARGTPAPRRSRRAAGGALGKGGAVTHAARAALAGAAMSGEDPVVLLCDGDLGESAGELPALVEAVRQSEADLAVAAFSTRASGGLGLALAFARFATRRRCGMRARAPLSGQRALRASVLRELLPFAPGYGMELGMTIDAVRAGYRVLEIDLPLTHRPTGRTLGGFAHRGGQLIDLVRVYLSRR